MPHARGPTLRVVPWVVATLAACAHPAPPTPVQASRETLVRRHYDQVCRIDRGEKPTLRVSEILDTAGLAAELAGIRVRPLPPDSQSSRTRWRTLDFITRYGRDGHPGPMGVWETTLDSTDAARVGVILRGRIKRLSGLLTPKGFRTVVVLSPRPTVMMASPVACLPHMVHREGERPKGLPRGVSTWLEADRFRPRPRAFLRDPTATVRIHLDQEGRVTAVDSLAGDGATMTRTRAIITQLHFDPALRNGEAVVGSLVESFSFPDGRRRQAP